MYEKRDLSRVENVLVGGDIRHSMRSHLIDFFVLITV